MKFCQAHWDELRSKTDSPLVAQVAAIQEMLSRFLLEGVNDVYRAQEIIESRGGCAACYFGPTFVPDLARKLESGELPLKAKST